MSRLPSAALMAEARRVYIPAMAWLREQGWGVHLYRGSIGASTRVDWYGPSVRPGVEDDESIVIEWYEYTGRNSTSWMRLEVQRGREEPENCVHPTSLPQAIDLLVSLGILPDTMHSLHVDMETVRHEAECDHGGRLIAADMFRAPDMFDTDGHRWMWHAAGYLREDDGTPLTRAEVIDQYGLVLEAS